MTLGQKRLATLSIMSRVESLHSVSASHTISVLSSLFFLMESPRMARMAAPGTAMTEVEEAAWMSSSESQPSDWILRASPLHLRT